MNIKFLAVLMLIMAATTGWSPSYAQQRYPARPIRILIPFPAAGAADTIGRTIAERLFVEINRALKGAEVRKRQNAAGIEPGGSGSREEFTKFVREDTARWAKIIRDAGIKVE